MKSMNKIVSSILVSIMLLQPFTVSALEKTETVYTNLDANGNAYKSIVNSHLYINEVGEVEDDTELKTLLNINGKEKYVQSERLLTWNASGKDIFYTGTIEKNQPISIKATYYLDGVETELSKMIGKSGKIEIVLDFTNNCYNESKNLYTPFVVTVGTTLSSNTNRNITINNGKVVNTGKDNMVVGIASPGLYESLQIDEFASLNQTIISFETTRFVLSDIYIVATPKILEDTDLSIFDKMANLTSSIVTLQDSMNQLEEGVIALEEGSDVLSNGTNELSLSLNTALEATKQLENGSIVLDTGVKQVITSLNEANALLQNKDISGSLANLQALKIQNTNAITTLQNTNATLAGTYTTYNLSAMTEEEIQVALASQGIDSATILNVITCKKTYEGNIGLIQLLSANNTAIDATIASLTELSTQITTLLTELNTALVRVEEGVGTLSSGLTELRSGMNQLYEGSIQLNNGANTLKEGVTTLSAGISTFNVEGIHKLTNIANTASQYSYKAKELVQLSKDYNGYGSNNATSTVFIYKMKSAK